MLLVSLLAVCCCNVGKHLIQQKSETLNDEGHVMLTESSTTSRNDPGAGLIDWLSRFRVNSGVQSPKMDMKFLWSSSEKGKGKIIRSKPMDPTFLKIVSIEAHLLCKNIFDHLIRWLKTSPGQTDLGSVSEGWTKTRLLTYRRPLLVRHQPSSLCRKATAPVA